MTGWIDRMNEDPTSWLLEADQPAVRHLALLRLLDRPPDDPEVAAAVTSRACAVLDAVARARA